MQMSLNDETCSMMPLMLVVKKKRRTSPAVRFETRDGQAFSPALEESSKACVLWEVCVRASWMRFSEVTVVFLCAERRIQRRTGHPGGATSFTPSTRIRCTYL